MRMILMSLDWANEAARPSNGTCGLEKGEIEGRY